MLVRRKRKWDRTIRISFHKSVPKEYRYWGITNPYVGASENPLQHWLQVSLGRLIVQIKYWLVLTIAFLIAFLLGRWTN